MVRGEKEMDKLLLSFVLVSGGYLIGYLTRMFQEQLGLRERMPELKEILEKVKKEMEDKVEDEQ